MNWLMPGYPLASPARDIVLASLILLLVALAGVGLAVWLRRKMLGTDDPSASAGGGLDIDTLEQMHQSGQLSDEEFKVLRKSALGLGKPQNETADSASSGPANGVDGTGDGSARPAEKSNGDEGQ